MHAELTPLPTHLYQRFPRLPVIPEELSAQLAQDEMHRKLFSSGLALDHLIDQIPIQRFSLGKNEFGEPRIIPRPLTAIFKDLSEEQQELAVQSNLCEGLHRIILSAVRNFPHNLVWDLDFMVGALIKEQQLSLTGDDPLHRLNYLPKAITTIENLFEMCGIHSPIRFPYLHDFILGIDWSRWVSSEPENRIEHGPYSQIFLDSLVSWFKNRTEQLFNEDPAYLQIAPSNFRNSHQFDRSPRNEWHLLVDLAEREWIPVEAWNIKATPLANPQFDHQIIKRAKQMGQSTPHKIDIL